MHRWISLALLATVGLVSLIAIAQPPARPGGIVFRVRLDPKMAGQKPESGRVLVAISHPDKPTDFLGTDPPRLPILGVDANAFASDAVITLDHRSPTFPQINLNELPAGEYTVQAIFASNRDINLPLAPGNRCSSAIKVRLDPASGVPVDLLLDKIVAEPAAKETRTVKYIKYPSRLLSEFHGRPMEYRVGIVLPPEFDKTPAKKYGLVVHIGGFGMRYTSAADIEPDPRFVQVLLDGAGPFGDPYQVNSANNGPYGSALTQEVIPYIEKTYRCLGTPRSRFTTGGSTGGWVSLALQVFYADFFNGCWSQCPDPVAFEQLELIDIYQDANAYVNKFGFERPAKRTREGEVIYTVRHECQIENVLGRSSRWELSGRDWCCWNATFGPQGQDGLPVPLWDGRTGAINKSVLEHWKKYDLKLVLEKHWSVLGPKLAGGKVNIWVGEADDYFLNNAVHRLKESTSKLTDPRFDGTILIEMRRGHESGGWTREQILNAMAKRAGL